MSTARQMERSARDLYQQDFFAWTQQQAQKLRAGQLSALDTKNLAEEVEDLGRSEKRALASHMTVLLVHLLKWQHQPELHGKSWSLTIATQRKELRYELAHSPSLKNLFNDSEWLDLVWSKARAGASAETGMDPDIFPESCPWDLASVMQEGWLPEAEHG
ncbi:DUF29 domain-containing protein [Acidithiobacillus sp. AMEEHan]|uniref:DUF29 domain-containing protein n=1 Tax=Acidithiobacillus sp. AMEEHan TaxID=2994951 RepID=UPI0027E5362B|nr:DUF29 domain-containing protein [Acidithiobacillus sp. AMEEHan]